jgi:hypothetical protein
MFPCHSWIFFVALLTRPDCIFFAAAFAKLLTKEQAKLYTIDKVSRVALNGGTGKEKREARRDG